MMLLSLRLVCLFVLFCASARLAPGVILFETGDPQKNTTTPGDNSGWQYEGQFGGFLGTPIAPLYFITANHIGGGIGQTFTFHGETFTTTATYGDPASDLRIWKVDHPFRTYAPLYLNTAGGNSETGRELRVIGRGTQRGGEMFLDGTLRGWAWGPGDGVQRWGSNTVAAVVSDSNGAPYLQASLDSPAAGGIANEAHLSAGDSGGAVFLLEDGLWKLAAINYGVDELYSAPNTAAFVAAIFDARGYYTKDGNGNFVQIPDAGHPEPTSFYSTRIAARFTWIQSVIIATDLTTLPTENFGDWLRAYFTPAQIAAPSVTDPNADADADGIPNLLEFAFNLDPTFAERATMTDGTGLRGLPLVRLETVAPTDEQRLTVEFVRRTAGSGSGLTYVVQFSSSLSPAGDTWQASVGSEAISPINARWERVKVTDSVAATGSDGQSRFARIVVTGISP